MRLAPKVGDPGGGEKERGLGGGSAVSRPEPETEPSGKSVWTDKSGFRATSNHSLWPGPQESVNFFMAGG